jgi:hypothetical protein
MARAPVDTHEDQVDASAVDDPATDAPAQNDDASDDTDDDADHQPVASTSTVASEGIRARRAIMLKQFLPGEGIDWINKNIVAAGKGTQAIMGRVFGICSGYTVKTNTLPDGTPSQSIVLGGAFQTENYMTGELGEGTQLYLPAAYSEKVKAIFDTGAVMDEAGREIRNSVRMVEIDCDIGVEATGKVIPYEWVVVAFREGEEMAVLKKMRASRQRPTFVLKTGQLVIEAVARETQAALPAPTA